MVAKSEYEVSSTLFDPVKAISSQIERIFLSIFYDPIRKIFPLIVWILGRGHFEIEGSLKPKFQNWYFNLLKEDIKVISRLNTKHKPIWKLFQAFLKSLKLENQKKLLEHSNPN